MVNLSKFTSNKKILSLKPKVTTNFVIKLCPLFNSFPVHHTGWQLVKLKTILKVLISTHQICWGSFVAFTFDHQFLTPYWIWILNSQVMVNLRFGFSLLLRPCSPMILLNLLMLILEKKEEPRDIGMGLGDNMPKMCLNTLI